MLLSVKALSRYHCSPVAGLSNQVAKTLVTHATVSAVQSDGERLPLAVKDLGSCDLYPQSLQHNANGRFVSVCGDGEYIIYTALAWRNKSFGSALEFVWGNDSNDFAIRFALLA